MRLVRQEMLVKPGNAWIGKHLHHDNGKVLFVAAGQSWRGMIAPKLLDDHRFSVVRRSEQKKTLRPNVAWFVLTRCFEHMKRRLCPRIADPPLASDESNALRVFCRCYFVQACGQMAEIRHYHFSIGNGGGAGEKSVTLLSSSIAGMAVGQSRVNSEDAVCRANCRRADLDFLAAAFTN